MIVVTGGTGFLGSWLIARLRREPLKIRAIHRKTSSFREFEAIQNFANHIWDKPHPEHQLEWVESDILDPVNLESAFCGASLIYHAAAMVSFHPADEKKMMDINVNGTALVLNTALALKIPHLIYISSVSALGRIHQEVTTEKTSWKKSPNPSAYSISKYKAEMEVWRAIAEGLNVSVVNPCIIHGPGDWNRGTCAIFNKIYHGLPWTTTGSNAWVDVRDVVEILIRLNNQPKPGQNYLLAGENLPYQSYFHQIANNFQLPSPKYFVPKWIALPASRILTFLGKITGTRPFITPEMAKTAYLKATYSSLKAQKEFSFQFKTVNETIQWTCEEFLKTQPHS